MSRGIRKGGFRSFCNHGNRQRGGGGFRNPWNPPLATPLIFDEMDTMPLALIDVLKSYLDHYPGVEKLDYRKSIFIFLSNTGGHLINNAVLNHLKEGKKREDLKIKQMDEIINSGEFNNTGGFWHLPLIENNLIDYFIPFMPLERSHIKMCAKADMRQKGYPVTDFILNRIADELLYFPHDLKVSIFQSLAVRKFQAKWMLSWDIKAIERKKNHI